MASKALVKLARAAAKAQAKANAAKNAWVEAFQAEYGHDDISDALVELIDYSHTETNEKLTAKFIDENSEAGRS